MSTQRVIAEENELALALRHGGEALAHLHGRGQQFALAPGQAGFVIEEIDVRRRTGLVQVNHALRFRRVMQRL